MDADDILVIPCILNKPGRFDVVIWGIVEPHDETCYASEYEANAKANELKENL